MNAQRRMLQIAEDAADWLLKLQAQPDAQCRREFIEWLRHSPRHVDEFLLMSATMRAVRTDAARGRIDVEKLVREAGSTVVAMDAPALPRREMEGENPYSSRLWEKVRMEARIAIAAAIVLTVGLGLLLLNFNSGTYSTPTGEQRSIKLADGSFVYLNTQSRIEVKFDERARDVRLVRGEALFVVAHERARPFRVLTDRAVVHALGTQFNVYERATGIRVAVIEGRVSLTPTVLAGASPVGRTGKELVAGEQADITEEGKIVDRRAANLQSAVAWRQRRLVFQSDTLADIAQEFNRYNRTQIRVEGEEAAQRRFTAVFNADEPQALLNFLRDDPALDMRSTASGTAIRPRRPASLVH